MENLSQPLLKMLEEYNFKKCSGQMVAEFRKGANTINVGHTQKVLTRANKIVPSMAMIENKGEIYNECKRIFTDFEFNAVQINKNFRCPPHVDNKNAGVSKIMSLGNFTGGDLIVAGEKIDIRYKPYVFNGSTTEHETDDFEGDRYAVVLFNLKQTCRWKIAIPSYKRALMLQVKTLATLERAGITKGITIFVADEEEKKLYRERIKKYKIVVGELGITRQRNFIKKHYKNKNECILVLDDDIERFETIDDNEKFVEITDLKALFTDCFITAKNNDVNLWGIYGAHNSMWMANKKTRFELGLSFIIGCCYGYVVEEDMKPYLMDENIICKQDYEQSLLHYFEKGNVLRFNKITMKTKFYAKGGLGEKEARLEQNKIDADLLCEKYPIYFNRKVRKCGTHEVYFKSNYQKIEME